VATVESVEYRALGISRHYEDHGPGHSGVVLGVENCNDVVAAEAIEKPGLSEGKPGRVSVDGLLDTFNV
jgi:hypothetical protein